MSGAPVPRPPRPWAALGWLTLSVAVRGLREGLIVRALAWPALLTGVAMTGAVAVAAAVYSSDTIAVDEPALVEPLRQAGLRVSLVEDPEAALESGRLDRAAWAEGEGWVLAARFAGPASLRAEGVLRRHAGAAWVPEVPHAGGRERQVGAAVRVMLGQLALLFVLYGVVFGAGGLLRDREDGTLEAELALPLAPRWHAAARILAAGTLLGVAFGASVLLLHGIIGVGRPLAWCVGATTGALAGVALGLGLMARAGRTESLSGPLSRAMVVGMGAVGLGWARPELGRHLPIAALGALVRDLPPSALGPALALGGVGLACWVFERSAR